ncbi:MAG TPA: methylmalonyl Co-A mutase-associated GTPase MeaB [Bacteroidales bacterium]|jgi:LAO/AO transport system kinase|nr:methylmalonyl Co-A mutase-associated GTPase MeaB [Bacteroidales bacterium]HNY57107.1 methylmalonyl Co-A mutase-associated GTPase MeaB [Bacteroidales bacterium]
MSRERRSTGALSVQQGVPQPPSINPEMMNRLNKRRRKILSADDYVDGILRGNRTILSQAITLIESNLTEHYDLAQEVVERCLPTSSRSVRIGITGVPGAGKSTFIETFGTMLTRHYGRRLAVLAIDPSSQQSGGSIMGDKTRMEQLSTDPDAFIRPSPSAGTLGGVARKTRESIILCEAAGFDTIIVETVGVGQSETVAHSMVDFFLVLMLAGAGDELQGIKRGIMEMADTIVITKADGNNIQKAEMARVQYKNALHLFPPAPSKWAPRVMTCSSVEKTGITDIWEAIRDYVSVTKSNGWFWERRREQAVTRMHETIIDSLKQSFYTNPDVTAMLPELERKLREGEITSYKPAALLLDKYFGNTCK